MKQKFAVFDIDGTLVRWQLFHAIVNSLGKNQHISLKSHKKIKAARMAWKNRNTENSFLEYEKILVDEYLNLLASISVDAYKKAVNEVFEEYKDQLFVYTRQLLKELKLNKYYLIAISGSHDEIIKKIAEYHGFNESIGAELSIKNGKFTGEINTPIHDKAAVLKNIVIAKNLTYEDSYGIGDSKGDISILSVVKNPIAFNPSKELFEAAKLNKWPIVIERKNVVYELSVSNKGYTLK